MSRVSVRVGARLLTLTCLSAAAALAADYYASATGSSSGDGSYSRPLDLETALSSGSPVRPGDTLYLRGGTYRKGPDPYLYRSRLTGAANQYVTVRSAPGESAAIDGEIEVLGAWSIFRDLRMFSSSALRYTSETGSWPSSIKLLGGFSVYADHVKIINNVIHDTRIGISSWREGTNNEIYGNLVYYTGWQAPDRAHGPGIYAQNEGAAKVIAENIVANQFRHGLQFYGSNTAPLDNLTLTGNVFFNNGYLAQSGASNNLLVGGGRVARNISVRENHSYFPFAKTAGGNNLGYWPSGAGCQGLTLEDNRLISGDRALAMHNCSVTSMKRNLIVGPLYGFSASSRPGNTYLATPRTSGSESFVRPNRYEVGRAHVIIYNWGLSNTVAVDVSPSGLQPGDSYELINAQNPEFDVRRGVYSGAPLAVSMTNRTVAAPNGWTSPTSTFPAFGVFLLVKSASGSAPQPPPDQTPPTVRLDAPSTGAQISGSIRLVASASDNVAVTRVEFLVDGQLVGSDLNAPYELTFDASTLSPGNHSLTARAHDLAGNTATSLIVSVLVPNPPTTSPTNPAPPTSPTAPSATIELNAEAGARAGLRIGRDDDATGGIYVIGQVVGGTLSFDLNVPAAASFSFWARGRSGDPTQGLWAVFVDGVQVGSVNTAAPNWAWSAMGGAQPTGFALSRGRHRLVLRADGFKAHVDALRFSPATGSSAPTPPAPTTPPPTPQPTTPPPGPAPTAWSVLLDDKQGGRSDIRVGRDGDAIGGTYAIGQRVGGRLAFQVDMPATGDVAVWARGRASSVQAGLWTILVDGVVRGTVSVGRPKWTWSATGGVKPTAIRLAAGSHKLEFRAEGFKGHLDAAVVTTSLTFLPTDGAPTPLSQ